MLYLEYVAFKNKYLEAQAEVNALLDEKALIFQRTQPKSSISDYERVDGGSMVNKTEEYIIEMERRHINERLDVAKAVMEDRRIMMMHKEEELRASKSRYDIVYTLKWLCGMSANDIGDYINCSESQVYRIIKKIRKTLK